MSNLTMFQDVLKKRLELIESVLGSKGQEYVRGDDRFSNFKHAAQYQGITPEKALIGMRAKHEISLLDMVNDLDNGKLPSLALLEEKIGDNINYLILLEGLIKERLPATTESIAGDDKILRNIDYCQNDARENIDDYNKALIDKRNQVVTDFYGRYKMIYE